MYCSVLLDLANDEDFKTLLAGGNLNVSLTEGEVSNISTIGKWFESYPTFYFDFISKSEILLKLSTCRFYHIDDDAPYFDIFLG